MKLLVVTTLYPNSEQPRHGIFVQTRLLKLLEISGHTAEVIAPVPWFPFSWPFAGNYAKYSKIPCTEERNGLIVHHPRYLVIPKIGMLLTPFSLALTIKRCVKKLRKKGVAYDLVDSHYYYPDGVAVAYLKSFFGKPVSITARGSDINLISQFRVPGRWIKKAAQKADLTITVSNALRDKMIELGVSKNKVAVIPNGVDTDFFKPLDRDRARQKWNISQNAILMVGNLVPEKGHENVIEAVREIDNSLLIIAGDGPLRGYLESRVESSSLSERVLFLGNLTQLELVELYNAADLLCLASEREGMPNVVLEALSCGCPVLAPLVGGVPEILSEEVGVMTKTNRTDEMAAGLSAALNQAWSREQIREYAKTLSWDKSVLELKSKFELLAARSVD